MTSYYPLYETLYLNIQGGAGTGYLLILYNIIFLGEQVHPSVFPSGLLESALILQFIKLLTS